jgi:3-hydroxybutyryl-CoA dehydratase
VNWAAELPLGTVSTFTKTVGECDVVLFAGLTGDLHPVHIDEEWMRGSPYGHRLVHGIFILGLMATAGARLTSRLHHQTVSLGYDEVRFHQPVFIGDTLTASSRISTHELRTSSIAAELTCINHHDKLVASATHALRVVVGTGTDSA